jgi:filamentous hemagglutinin family protein
MKSTRRHLATLALLPLLLTFGTKGSIAQITPATDGTGTIVQTQNNQINISGGTQAGSNQFHSFQQFGVNAGQTANFIANPNIANILGRVTGGDASLINGMLKVSGSNANLYLINPAGIVFGKDASLNIPAAFTATTANGIGFGNGNWFNAIGSNNYASLTANPTSFGFSGLSGSIVNAGNLSVNPGQSIALVGGTVVNTGTIAAPGGDITIAAIPGEKMVRIGQAGTVLSLDLPTSDRALINAPITTPLSLPALLTGGSIPSAMGVVVEDGVIRLTDGSASVTGTLNADGTGLQSGGNVVAYADKHLSFGGTISAKGGELGGNGGFVDTSGKGTIAIAPNAQVLTTATKGLMGTWLIDPADLEVVAGNGGTIGGADSTIGAGTIVTALNGTNVNLQADNSITVNAAIDSSANASAGNLTLTAPTANLNQAITLKTGSTLSGTATTVNVGATGTVQNGVDVAATNGTVNLAAATYTLAREVVIGKNLTVRGTGAATTTVSGNNAVQVFQITSGTVTLDKMSIVNGRGGITNSGTLTVSNSTLSGNIRNSSVFYNPFFGVPMFVPGRGGGIYSTGTLTVNNSTFSGNTAAGEGGGIYSFGTLTVNNTTFSENGGGGIFNNDTSTVNNSTFSGNRAVSGGGIYNRGTLTVNNSTLSGNTATSGGGIDNANTLTMNNSTLSGNAAQYGGGIYNRGILTVSNSTLSGNMAQQDGGGISALSMRTTVSNSIFAGNVATNGREIHQNNSGTFTSNGYNLFGYGGTSGLVGVTPATTDITPSNTLSEILAPLANYGGPTKTHALLPGSVAINAGDPSITTADQRGVAPVGPRDIGAYESKGFALSASPTSTPQSTTVNTAFAEPLQINVVETAFSRPILVSGIVVQLTTPDSGASATSDNTTATTDANGQVSILITANKKSGTYTVNANAASLASEVDFILTNTADKPSQILPTNANQTAIVNQSFNRALQVQVLDQYGNPIANNAVTLTLPSNGASGVFAGGVNSIVLTTDDSGLVTTPLTANNTPGTYSGSIAVTGISQTSQFTFTNEADPINSINPITPITPNQPVVPIDRTRNLENRNPEKPIVAPSNGKAILCVERSNGSASDNNAYQGIATCGSSSAQSNSDVGNTSRNGNRQARTDDQRSLVKPLVEPVVEVR